MNSEYLKNISNFRKINQIQDLEIIVSVLVLFGRAKFSNVIELFDVFE